MTLAQLLEQRSRLLKEARAILDKESPTEDELTRAKAAQEEVRALDGKIDLFKSQTANEARSEESLGAVSATRSESENRGAKVELGQDRTQLDPRRGFRNDNDFLTSAMRALRGGRLDPRLRPLIDSEARAAGSDEMGSYANPYGGFLVPEAFVPQPLSVGVNADPISQYCRRIPMTAPSIKFNARVDKNHSSSVSGGLTVARRAETSQMTGSRPELEQIKLDADSLYGLAIVTEELLRDSAVSVAALLQQGFGDEFGAHLTDERLNGTGVGEYLGIMNSPAKIEVDAEASQTGDNATTIVALNVLKMRKRIWGYGRSIWMANEDTYDQIAQLAIVSGTTAIATLFKDMEGDLPARLLGRPIVFTEFCQTIGTTGDIVLVNWNEYLEGVYQATETAESPHVRFEYYERVYRFVMRCGGAPWWRSALTPKNSSSTLSPIVTLATRS